MQIALLIILSYFIGSIPTGLIIGKVFFNKDIRQFGSGNMGATNTFRVLGRNAGIFVTIFDVFKGFIVVLFPLFFDVDINGVIFGLASVLGHVYPIHLKFKGGKAVATSAGVILGASPLLFLIIAITFFTLLFFTKYVSLSSMITSIVNFTGSLLLGDWLLILISFCIMIIVIVRHKSNISRIINGTEPKLKF